MNVQDNNEGPYSDEGAWLEIDAKYDEWCDKIAPTVLRLAATVSDMHEQELLKILQSETEEDENSEPYENYYALLDMTMKYIIEK
jgi:hypothetical protein